MPQATRLRGGAAIDLLSGARPLSQALLLSLACLTTLRTLHTEILEISCNSTPALHTSNLGKQENSKAWNFKRPQSGCWTSVVRTTKPEDAHPPPQHPNSHPQIHPDVRARARHTAHVLAGRHRACMPQSVVDHHQDQWSATFRLVAPHLPEPALVPQYNSVKAMDRTSQGCKQYNAGCVQLCVTCNAR